MVKLSEFYYNPKHVINNSNNNKPYPVSESLYKLYKSSLDNNKDEYEKLINLAKADYNFLAQEILQEDMAFTEIEKNLPAELKDNPFLARTKGSFEYYSIIFLKSNEVRNDLSFHEFIDKIQYHGSGDVGRSHLDTLNLKSNGNQGLLCNFIYEHGVNNFRKIVGETSCVSNLHEAKEFCSILAMNIGNLFNIALTTFNFPVFLRELPSEDIYRITSNFGVYNLFLTYQLSLIKVNEWKFLDKIIKENTFLQTTTEEKIVNIIKNKTSVLGGKTAESPDMIHQVNSYVEAVGHYLEALLDEKQNKKKKKIDSNNNENE